MWQWLFVKKATDCPAEHKALCRGYHICFEDENDWNKWKEIEAEKFEMVDHRNAYLMNGVQPSNGAVIALDEEIQEYDKTLQPWRQKAMERGKLVENRERIAGDL